MKIYGRIISSVLTFTLFVSLCGCGGGGGGGGAGGGGGSGGSSVSHTVSGDVSTFAGEAGNIGSNDAVNGPNAPASFNGPNGITSDGTNLYVTDSINNTIRKIVIATGDVTTLAGTAGTKGSTDTSNGPGSVASFNFPTGITTDGTNLYVTDTNNNTIREIAIATGVVTTLAGTAGTAGSTDAPSGPGTSASFNNPVGITTDGTNLYVADFGNNTIRKIVIASGVVSTLAGTAGTTGSTDAPNGPGTLASFNGPSDITTDGTNLYVADFDNNTIRKIVIATGDVTTLAGTAGTKGSIDGPGASASFNGPGSITTDKTNLYVSDAGNNTIRKIVITSGAVTTLAGTAGTSGSTNAPSGHGSAASFNEPSCLVTVGANLYVADYGNDTIRQIVIASGAVTTLSGTAGTAGSVDNTASFSYPTGITTDGTNLYVTDSGNNTIRQIVIASGVVTTLAGTAGPGGSTNATGSSASFNYPIGITTDGTNLYVADYNNNTIRQIVIKTGAVTTLAGTGTAGSANGSGTSASFNGPSDIIISTDRTKLYVPDYVNNTIRQIVINNGAVTTLAGSGTAGSANGTRTSASFNGPDGITTDGTNLYVSDAGNYTIRKIVIATGAVTTLAGTAGTKGSTDSPNGPGSAASFNAPSSLTTDGTNLYVADYSNDTIRQIVIATGAVTTLAGTGTAGSTDAPNGPGIAASFNGPNCITTVGTSLYVTDSGNNTIRKIQ
jgi:DNA-binding beta-propeller fold protein YncE